MSLLSRDQILGAEDRTYEVVTCPEWGGDVRLRSLTGSERDEWENSLVRQVGDKRRLNARNMRAKLIALSAVDEHGAPLFSSADVIKLGSKNAAPLDRLFEACQRLSGLSDKDVEELEEGFGETQGAPSASA
ncbi:hypothetical protein [Actinomadura formosensis]|uniref:hypothetical protein n=1 Tax=Actinomadura formosensis TaxID=60706 RepID=UPI003D922732